MLKVIVNFTPLIVLQGKITSQREIKTSWQGHSLHGFISVIGGPFLYGKIKRIDRRLPL